MDALTLLKSTEPTQWLTPSASLSENARAASSYLFSSINPHTPKCPFEKLLVKGFDAEQIWQQIDIQSQPLISSLRRQLTHYEKNPNEIRNQSYQSEPSIAGAAEPIELDEGIDGSENDYDNEDESEDEDQEAELEPSDDREMGDEGDEIEGIAGGVEDKFLKINELEEYLEEDEAREYGGKKLEKNSRNDDSESDEEDEDDDSEELEDEEGADAKYEDFFVSKPKSKEAPTDLSTHEKQLQKAKIEIERLEKANMEPKSWTMQGEVTASKRPLNSALEVDLDFEHNIRQAPVIIEEQSSSLEEIIKSRILEGRFDDIVRAVKAASKTLKEAVEIDDNKSKKGLAEVYEDEYVQKTNPFAAPVSYTDELKKEASALFKNICLRLDALSHFHFAPKPVIEDMAIETNVPALAIEEIAPISVSDAAMLAPEEVFAGKDGLKDESELTKADRKRRRAGKKRKFKAKAAAMAKKTKVPVDSENKGAKER